MNETFTFRTQSKIFCNIFLLLGESLKLGLSLKVIFFDTPTVSVKNA